MSKVLFAISLVGLLACGAGESDTGAIDSGSDTPAVSAAVPASDEVEVEEVEIIKGGQGNVEAAAAAARSCIGLVASGDFEDALPVCLEAASIDADNAEVQAALAKAEAETAKQAASDAAGDAAGDAVGSALGELGN
jgi:hypothetical protein